MGEKGGIYVLDEPPVAFTWPTSELFALLDWLVDSGRSVIIIEHHQAVMPTLIGS